MQRVQLHNHSGHPTWNWEGITNVQIGHLRTEVPKGQNDPSRVNIGRTISRQGADYRRGGLESWCYRPARDIFTSSGIPQSKDLETRWNVSSGKKIGEIKGGSSRREGSRSKWTTTRDVATTQAASLLRPDLVSDGEIADTSSKATRRLRCKMNRKDSSRRMEIVSYRETRDRLKNLW